MTSNTTGDLVARAELHTDWRLFIEDPHRGTQGYCAGHGADDIDPETGLVRTEPFTPELATRALAAGGWEVVGEWRPAPEGADHAYEATVRPAAA